jgi:LmbE family N-acetylglucosaminyl deacetylase
MNPYRQLVSDFARGIKRGRKFPLEKFTPAARLEFAPHAPKVLLFSPHPDDECIIGGLALRLLREAKMRVINVAVTLGNKKSRRAGRLRELKGACGRLGFGLILTRKDGLEKITLEGRRRDKANWTKAVNEILQILLREKPKVVFVPHENDVHPTHIGTHFMVLDALKRLPKSFRCYVVETEYWGAMDTPNLMVELSEKDLTDLVTALSFHAGEVRRNAFHLRLPAWMQDNVRRGAEIVGKRGGKAPDFVFATLYRVRLWKNSGLRKAYATNKMFSVKSSADTIFRRSIS